MQNNLEEIIREGTSLSEQFKKFSDSLKQLEDQKKETDATIKKLETEIEEVGRRLETETKNAHAAKELKNSIYAPLIQELFEQPKEDLKKSVIEESKKSGKKTVKWALISVLASVIISLGFTIYSNIKSSKSSKKSAEYIFQLNNKINRFESSSTESTSTILENSIRTIKLFQMIWPDKNVIVGISNLLEKHKANFNNFESKGDIARFYELYLIDDFSVSKHVQFQSALKTVIESANHQNLIPSQMELSLWCNNLIQLLKNAQNEVKKLNDDQPEKNGENFYDNYKVASDTLDYGDWGWEDITKDGLLVNIKFSLEKAIGYQNINTTSIQKPQSNKISK